MVNGRRKKINIKKNEKNRNKTITFVMLSAVKGGCSLSFDLLPSEDILLSF
jgi:hypothetical protein